MKLCAIMGSGKMGQWFIGKISLERQVNKCVTSFENQHGAKVAPDGLTRSEACAKTSHCVPNIPPFHYSMREAKTQASKTSYICNKLENFRDVSIMRLKFFDQDADRGWNKKYTKMALKGKLSERQGRKVSGLSPAVVDKAAGAVDECNQMPASALPKRVFVCLARCIMQVTGSCSNYFP